MVLLAVEFHGGKVMIFSPSLLSAGPPVLNLVLRALTPSVCVKLTARYYESLRSGVNLYHFDEIGSHLCVYMYTFSTPIYRGVGCRGYGGVIVFFVVYDVLVSFF